MSIKDLVVGGLLTVAIGGTTYTVSQTDVIDNFASDSGMSQQEAERYVNGISEDELVSWTELGTGHITEGEGTLSAANEIDCVNYEYEWETSILTCDQGKAHLIKTGNDEISLGMSYKQLDNSTASATDITATIGHIDTFNVDLSHEIFTKMLEPTVLDESKNSNSYNKSVLKASLDSNK